MRIRKPHPVFLGLVLLLVFLCLVLLGTPLLLTSQLPTPTPAPPRAEVPEKTPTPIPPTVTSTPVPPTATSTPIPLTATPTPIPTPLPLQAPGWEGVTVETLCLEVKQSYLQIQQAFSQPIAEATERILTRLGIQVAADGAPCDATLSFDLTFQALGAEYQGGYYRYTGAEVEGQMILILPGRAPFALPVSGKNPTSPGIMVGEDAPKHGKPEDAPFDRAYKEALLDSMADLWGPQVLTRALGDQEISYEAYWLLRRMEPDAVAVLTQAVTTDEDVHVRMEAAKLLEFEGLDGVPALIRALEDDFFPVREAAAESLADITGQDFGEDAERWQQWWEEQQ